MSDILDTTFTSTVSEELIRDFSAPKYTPSESILECMERPMSVSNFRRVITLLLRNHYSDASNMGQAFAHLACLKWDADTKQRSMNVDFWRKMNDLRPDDFPAVLVAFGEHESKRDTIAAYAGHNTFNSETYIQHPTTAHLDVWHIHPDEGTAYDMAEMTQVLLMALSQPLCEKTGAMSIQVPGFGPPKSELPAPDNHYAVVTRVQIYYTLSVVRSLESHRLRGWFTETTVKPL